MPLGETVRDPRILLFLALWVAINAYFGLSAVRIAGQEGGSLGKRISAASCSAY